MASDNLDLILRRHQEISARLTQGASGAQYSHCRASSTSLSPWSRRSRPSSPKRGSGAILRRSWRPDLDADMRAMAEAELDAVEGEADAMSKAIRIALLPKDAADEGNAILEVRAGTGGDEAALFAGDLFRMYVKYAERKRWKVEILSTSEGAAGGFKEIVAEISGRGVSPGSSSRAAFTGCSGCPRPRRKDASTLPPRPSPCCRSLRDRTSKSRSRSQDRHLSLLWRRRPACQQDQIGDPHHPPSDRGGGRDAGGALPASQPHQGDGPLTLAHSRRPKPKIGRRAGAGAALPGRFGRPFAAHPNL